MLSSHVCRKKTAANSPIIEACCYSKVQLLQDAKCLICDQPEGREVTKLQDQESFFCRASQSFFLFDNLEQSECERNFEEDEIASDKG